MNGLTFVSTSQTDLGHLMRFTQCCIPYCYIVVLMYTGTEPHLLGRELSEKSFSLAGNIILGAYHRSTVFRVKH